MKSFSEFVTEEKKYNRDQHIKKLVKMAQTLENQIRRSNYSSKNSKTWRLIYKYDDLMQQMKDQDYEGWKKYCKDKDWSPSHTGSDFLA
jgi:hypothetical protein